MVKVDCVETETGSGEPVEKAWPAFAAPRTFTPGPVTEQEATPLAFQVSVVVLLGAAATRRGEAEMVAEGARTRTEAKAGEAEPPAPEQMTW